MLGESESGGEGSVTNHKCLVPVVGKKSVIVSGGVWCWGRMCLVCT